MLKDTVFNMANKTSNSSILPYTCVYLDTGFTDMLRACVECFKYHRNRNQVIEDLKSMWINSDNPNHVLPCLSVRTALDLFLKVQNYPKGSEVIMSAINIPDMVYIVRHYGLKIVPLDVEIDTVRAKVELLESLITDKTVAILIAQLYGKWFDLDPIIDIAQKRNIQVIEDCAEGFCGFEKLGNPRCDLSLFSFGIIKFYTAYGGAIAKIRDESLYNAMCELYSTYPVQRPLEYCKKVLKYCLVYLVLDCPGIIKPGMFLTRTFNIDHKKIVIKMLRGFPEQMIRKIRQRPSDALLVTLRKRLKSFNVSDFSTWKIKGDYVRERLPDFVTLVGSQSEVNNYWLFPILVEMPDTVVQLLNAMGVDAYRGATQLNLIEPENGDKNMAFSTTSYLQFYPHEARHLIDHVVYLPVNKSVPFHVLDQICKSVTLAVKLSTNGDTPAVRLHSKL